VFQFTIANVFFSIKKDFTYTISMLLFKQYLLALRSLLGRSSKLRLVNIVLDAAMNRTHEHKKRLHLNTVFCFNVD